MRKRLLLAAAALLLSACSSADTADATGKALARQASMPPAKVKSDYVNTPAGDIPAEIRMPSAVGEVTFRHQMHVKEFKIECVQCHHQINARAIDTPHPEYLHASGINCKACHTDTASAKRRQNPEACSDKIAQNPYTCLQCHQVNPRNIADETLSAKVVVHKQCWKCHQAGTGQDASASCRLCHSGKKSL